MQLTGSLGRNRVSPVLHQNLDDLSFLNNGTPQVLELTVEHARPNLSHRRRTVSQHTVDRVQSS